MLAGKAAGLNDDQIVELARLQCGVAAVYQNDWIQPVLCKVQEYTDFEKGYVYQKPDASSIEKTNALAELSRLALRRSKIDNLKDKIEQINITSFRTFKAETVTALFPNNEDVFRTAVYNEQVIKAPKQGLYDYLIQHIEPSLEDFSKEYRNHILKCIVSENCKYHSELRDVPAGWELFIDRMGVRLV